MSTSVDNIAREEICISKPCSGIDSLVHSQKKDLGEFSVHRALPVKGLKKVGPWIFFDHMGPAVFAPDQGVNVRPHPHINLATVTYLFEGEIMHRDSLGYVEAVRPGDVNMMVTGSGMVHSERESPEARSRERRLHGLQLWMGLPEKDEETDPAFYNYPSASIPDISIAGVSVRVLIGTAYGLTSPVKTFAETLYLEAQLNSGHTLLMPNAEERALYVASGSVEINGTVIPEFCMAVLSANARVEVIALEESRLAIVGGAKMGERHMDWNFASSRKERIEQAKEDWLAQRFPRIPGDDQEFIPYPS